VEQSAAPRDRLSSSRGSEATAKQAAQLALERVTCHGELVIPLVRYGVVAEYERLAHERPSLADAPRLLL
jgi:hypothetical protein